MTDPMPAVEAAPDDPTETAASGDAAMPRSSPPST